MRSTILKSTFKTLAVAAALAAIAAPAYAAGSGMPWETPLQSVVDSITGPVARAAAVIAIVLAGITIIFSEGGGGVGFEGWGCGGGVGDGGGSVGGGGAGGGFGMDCDAAGCGAEE